jgi:hypothetical protein
MTANGAVFPIATMSAVLGASRKGLRPHYRRPSARAPAAESHQGLPVSPYLVVQRHNRVEVLIRRVGPPEEIESSKGAI